MTYSQSFQRKNKKDQPQIPLWLKTLLYCALVLSIWAIWQSIAVYVGLGVSLAAQASAQSSPISLWWESVGLWGWVRDFFGAIATFVSAVFSVIAMAVLYGILQLGELAPLLVEHSPQVILAAISGLRAISFSKVQILDEDSPMVAYLKGKYNSYGDEFFDTLYTLKPIAYLVDLVICLIASPPIEGGWNRLDIIMLAPSMSDIDWNSLASLGITLFSVEVFVGLWLWLRKGKFVFGQMGKLSPN